MVESKVKIPVQVNGKLRSVIEVDSDKSEDKDFVVSLARQDAKVSKWLTGSPKR